MLSDKFIAKYFNIYIENEVISVEHTINSLIEFENLINNNDILFYDIYYK
jgi:hypothetical protein